jgi:ribosomal protein L7/L12
MTSIRSVTNGFIVEHGGYEFVAKSLTEAAAICGEGGQVPGHTVYAPNHNEQTLYEVRASVRNGRKIEAIKKLRECFVPRLGLREAKELVEILCG